VSEIRVRVDEMLALLRLDRARHRAPGGLSGGEKKRLALASVLAMHPSVLILDEPLGGLDPIGRREVLTALSNLRRDRSVTIVMVESDPEAVVAFADRLVVLRRPTVSSALTGPVPGKVEGRQIALEGPPRDLFRHVEQLTDLGVAVPQMAHVAATLNRQLGTSFEFYTVDEAQAALAVHLA
jgi:energy-coupling factor transport system ATP-binding protein